MANSKYEYVRDFEQPDQLLPRTWIVVRIDGRGFTKFTTRYQFEKPNDRRALDLMNAAAVAVMKDLPDLVLAYGDSDEFSFIFHKNCSLFERRSSKLMTTIVSTFTANYTFLWSTYFPNSPLSPPLPSFDGRCVCYPSDEHLRDYLSWRQVDCHINNLYNTTFWTLVNRGNMPAREAEQLLKGTVSSDKNEILFSRFGINYNNEPDIFKKGSVVYRDFFPPSPPEEEPAQAAISMPPLSHPRPRRSIPRPMSQPLERTAPDLLRDSPLSDSTVRGPTFLSTSTTPSPPPSPRLLSNPAFSNPFSQTTLPQSSATANGGHSHSNSTSKSPLPQLTPLPLPPPTLKPSTRPPPFLNPPNAIAHTNTSPQPTPQIPSSEMVLRRSASNSSKPNALVDKPATSVEGSKLKHRSPSLSMIDYTAAPPIIPLRISSIPVNNKTRKVSLASQKSSTFNTEKENHDARAGISTPMSTMKELPSPPGDDMIDLRNKVMAGEIRFEMASANPSSRPGSRLGPEHQGEQESHRLKAQQRSQSHSRLHSAPPTISSLHLQPNLSSAASNGRHQKSHTSSSASLSGAAKPNNGKARTKVIEEGGWAASTKEPSRTQREKDRKKKTKAQIVIEHVDIIKDEFWEKRPWLLTGKAGV